MFKLVETRALVTGATGGIGMAIAAALATMGAQVCVTGRREGALADLVQSLPEGAAVPLVSDIQIPEEAATLITKAESVLGGALDIVVCNAGITADNISLRLSDEEWERVIDTNLTANFRLNRAAIKSMLRSRIKGRIINISSVIASVGNKGQANYAASKGGLEAMSRSLAHEVASRGITINCIAPGFIVSPMTEAMTPEQVQAITSHIPAQRLGTPADVAAVVAFLASPAAGYITGTTIHVNGGMYMG